MKVLLLFQTFPCMGYHSDSTVPSCKAGTAFASDFKAPPSSSDPQGHLRTWRPQSFPSLRFEREEAAVQFSLHIPIPPLCARGMFVPVEIWPKCGRRPSFQTAPSYFFTRTTLNLSVTEALGVVFLLRPLISQSLTSKQKRGARDPTGEQPVGCSFLFILFL